MRWGTTKDFVHPSKLDIFVMSSHGANMYMPKIFKNGISSLEKIEFQNCFIHLVYSQFWGGFWVLTWCPIKAPVVIMLGYIFKSCHMASFNIYIVPLGHLIWIFKISIFSVVLHESHGLGHSVLSMIKGEFPNRNKILFTCSPIFTKFVMKVGLLFTLSRVVLKTCCSKSAERPEN